MAEQIKSSLTTIGRVWCKAMHNRPMWPIHGEYECSTCLRRYRVPWDQQPVALPLETAMESVSSVPRNMPQAA